jgi:hypothetical protein
MWDNNTPYVHDRQRFSSGVSTVARSALRLFACAGVLGTGLLMGGGIAVADTGDAANAAPDAAAVTSKSDASNSSAGVAGSSNPEPPTSTVGNGRDNVDVKTSEDDEKNNGVSSTTKKFKDSPTIPAPGVPRQDELPKSGLPNPCLFYTTLMIPVQTLGELFAAMQPQPPTPPPGPTLRTQSPAFKTQEQAPPVADSGGGGVDPVSAGVVAEPPVLQAPLVIAPLRIPVSAAPPPVAPLGAAAGAAPAPVVGIDVAAAGARAPVIRGSLQPTTEPAGNPSMMSTSGQATRLGYPRYLREPTVGELALLALPGLAGLLVLTTSGGVIGYRQANSARTFRTQSAARFLR